MRRRVQIQPDDIGCLRLEIRIVGGHVTLDPMRFESVLSPDRTFMEKRARTDCSACGLVPSGPPTTWFEAAQMIL
jgi:hypothetical protein